MIFSSGALLRKNVCLQRLTSPASTPRPRPRLRRPSGCCPLERGNCFLFLIFTCRFEISFISTVFRLHLGSLSTYFYSVLPSVSLGNFAEDGKMLANRCANRKEKSGLVRPKSFKINHGYIIRKSSKRIND